MAKFNLKQANQSVPQVENRLRTRNDELKTEAIDDSGSYQYRLRGEHSDPAGDTPYQKLMEEARNDNDGDEITEAAMNRSDGKTINDMKVRSDDMANTPLMDYAKKMDNEDVLLSSGKRDTKFWDEVIGPGSPGHDSKSFERTKVVKGHGGSQLVSNYDSREDFEKANKMAKAASGLLRDADAIIFSVYRKAAQEGRSELTGEEQQVISDINSGKIRILSGNVPQNLD